MEFLSQDLIKLASKITPETGRIPYEPNKYLFTKIAFDVFQLNSSPVESLWKLEDGEDGAQFLVAQYLEEEPEIIEVKSHWKALSDRDGKNVTLTYKNAPIQRFANSDYGFNAEDVHIFQQILAKKLSSDESFVKKLLKSQPKVKLDLLVSQFPELQALAVDPEWKPTGHSEPASKGYGEFYDEPELEHESGPQGPGWPSKEEEPGEDIEDAKIEAMHMAARAIKAVDKLDKFSKQDIQEIINSLAEELDAV